MSTLKVNTIQDTSGNTQYTAKAWVNFNGTGTVAIRANGNVSSITDNGTGNYTVNFTNSMTDANYAYTAGVSRGSNDNNINVVGQWNVDPTTSSLRINCPAMSSHTSNLDAEFVSVLVFR